MTDDPDDDDDEIPTYEFPCHGKTLHCFSLGLFIFLSAPKMKIVTVRLSLSLSGGRINTNVNGYCKKKFMEWLLKRNRVQITVAVPYCLSLARRA